MSEASNTIVDGVFIGLLESLHLVAASEIIVAHYLKSRVEDFVVFLEELHQAKRYPDFVG